MRPVKCAIPAGHAAAHPPGREWPANRLPPSRRPHSRRSDRESGDLRAGDTPDWSPDGRRILFRSNFDYQENVSANLYTIRPNGTQLQQLTFEQGGTVNYLGSSYSPDGKMITMGRRPATGGTNADVFVMRADGSNIRPVTATVLYDSYPDWGPAPRGRHR